MSALGQLDQTRRRRLAGLVDRAAPSLAERQRFILDKGVGDRTLSRAAARQTLSAGCHLALCQALGLDPVTLKEPAADMPPFRGALHWGMAGTALAVMRHADRLDQRGLAKRLKLSLATISRAEAGHEMSLVTLFAVAAYVGVHPHAWSVSASCFTGNNK